MRFRWKTRRWAGFGLLALLASAILSACGDNSANFTQPAGEIAKQQSDIFWFILVVATIIFVVVTGWLLISIVRFRARPDSAAARQIHGNSAVEIAWTVAPSLVLFLVLAFTIKTMFALAQPASSTTLQVQAIGHQWWWEFRYPGQNVVTADELHVPLNTVVQVSLISDNVIHSFWVPSIAGKMDVIPGHDNVLWFRVQRAGTYRGECTEYCGEQHAHMDFIVVAESQDSYQAWLTGQQGPAASPAAGSAAALGKQLFLTKGCVGCHVIDGVTPASIKYNIGPNLTHFGSRQLIAGGVLDNNTANLMEWIWHAQTVKPDVDMPSFDGSSPPNPALTQDEVSNLVAYLQSLQ